MNGEGKGSIWECLVELEFGVEHREVERVPKQVWQAWDVLGTGAG